MMKNWITNRRTGFAHIALRLSKVVCYSRAQRDFCREDDGIRSPGSDTKRIPYPQPEFTEHCTGCRQQQRRGTGKSAAATFIYSVITLLSFCGRVAAVDTTFLPRLSPNEQAAVVQVIDRKESTTGTGFVVGRNEDGYPLVLTNEHTVESGHILVILSDKTAQIYVDVVATDVTRDLALLLIKTRRPIPSLELAPRTYSVARETPVLAVGASKVGLLHHMGTFEIASEFNHESADAVYASSYIFTPEGFSGGPLLVVDPKTRRHFVIAVTAQGSATQSSGPWITEVHDWLDEIADVTGVLKMAHRHRNPVAQVDTADDTFPGMFDDEDEVASTPRTPPIVKTPSKLPTTPTPSTPASTVSPGVKYLPPAHVHHIPSVSSRVSVSVNGNRKGVVIYTEAYGTQHVFWDTPRVRKYLQQLRKSQ